MNVDAQLFHKNLFSPLRTALHRNFLFHSINCKFSCYSVMKKTISPFACSPFQIYSGARNATVKVGTNELLSGGSVYEVHKIIPHENYNETNYSNDICLIQINGVIKFTQKVQPIKYSKKFVKAGTALQTTGWGRVVGVSIFVTKKAEKKTIKKWL